MSGLKGDVSKLTRLAKALKEIPTQVAAKVATAVAPALTDKATAAFDAGVTPYGDAWPLGVDGQTLTLRKTGALERGLRFVAFGTRVRAVLGVKYAKYYMGRILPRGGTALPVGWSQSIRATANEEIRAALGRAS